MNPITDYFAAERAESLLFGAVGAAALALAAWAVWGRRASVWRGAAWPLALVAAIQISVGATIWWRTPQDVARVQQVLQQPPAAARAQLQADEIPRMQAVMANFGLYRWIEIALLGLGLGGGLLGKPGSAWRGAGWGLAGQAALMLGLDYFAEARGNDYLAWLRSR